MTIEQKELTREDLLAKQDLAIEKVEFEDGTYTFVKEMTGRARDRWERSLMREITDDNGKVTDYERSMEDFRAKLACFTVCDSEGKLLFKPTDFGPLSENMGATRLERIVNKAQDINAISEKDKEKLVKNSEGGETANSISDFAES